MARDNNGISNLPSGLDGFKCSRNGLAANKGLTREQWEEAGHALFAIEGCLAWYIGDWLAACKGETWGYGDLDKLCKEMGWNYGTAKHYKSVAESFELSNRIDNLSFSHHLTAQGENQDELLQWASENKATTSELRNEKRKRRDSHLEVPEKPEVDNVQTLLAGSIDDSVTLQVQETTEKPKQAKGDFGKCPNCAGVKWNQSANGPVCSKCNHPYGEATGGADEQRVADQRAKTVKFAEALMREFDDLNLLSPKRLHAETITHCKQLLEIAKGWK